MLRLSRDLTYPFDFNVRYQADGVECFINAVVSVDSEQVFRKEELMDCFIAYKTIHEEEAMKCHRKNIHPITIPEQFMFIDVVRDTKNFVRRIRVKVFLLKQYVFFCLNRSFLTRLRL